MMTFILEMFYYYIYNTLLYNKFKPRLNGFSELKTKDFQLVKNKYLVLFFSFKYKIGNEEKAQQ